MKKKILALALAACVTAFTGCGGTSGQSSGSQKNDNVVKGLPDYSAYEETRELWIGGWNPPPPKHTTAIDNPSYDFQTAARYKQMAESGINVGICVYEEKTRHPEEFYNALDLAEETGIKLLVMDYDVRPESFDSNITAEDLLRKTSTYNEHPAFLGHHAYDEPGVDSFDSIGALKKVYAKAFPDKSFFVNLYPSYSSTKSLGTSSGYEYYVQHYIDRVSPDLLSVDYYPLKGSAQKPVLYTGLLSDYEIYAENAKLYDIPFYAFIGTMGFTSAIRQPSIYDLRFMVNAALMFGADGINHFCYWQPYDSVVETDQTHAMILRDGTVTDLYYDVKTVNYEVKSFDHVLMSFDWQGIMVNAGESSGGKLSTSFKQLKNPVEKHARIASISSERDVAAGIFKDTDGYDGFYVMNYENPGYTDRKNNVKIKFNNADRAIVCYRNEEKVVTLNDGEYSCELKAGDAFFIIPVKD